MQTSTTPAPAPSSSSATQTDQGTVDNKILADLNVLKEKMDLCEKMLNPGDGSPAPSLKDNETMLTVIGFLEACAPRMVELVGEGATGRLSETALEECLVVNDRLHKLLEDVETLAETETAASTTAASAPKSTVEEQLDELLLDDSEEKEKDPFAATGKSTGEDPFAPKATTTTDEDPFGNQVLTPTPATGKTTGEDDPPPDEQAKAEDDFDAFLEERTSK